MSLGDDGYGGDYGDRDQRPGGSRADGRLTRTRLPEGDGDPYGPPRRPTGRPKSGRNLITVVGVVVLLIAAIAFANRGGGDGGTSDDKGSGGSSGDNAQSQPTAPSGERPVKGKDQSTQIATGFPKTRQGAESAAANYAVALGSVGMYRSDSRHSIVDTVYAPDVVKAQQTSFDRVYTGKDLLTAAGLDSDGQAPKGMTFVSRANPVGAKADKVEGNTASVAVWCSSLLGLAGQGSTRPVSEAWYTKTLELKWVAGDWKVTGFTQKDGPAPVGRDQAASSAEDMVNAVEGFGGFTYAR